MKTNLKASLSQVKTLLVLTLLSLLLGTLSILFDDLLISPITALLALIFIFDSEKRYFSYATSGLLIVINGAGIISGLTVSFYSIEAIILAFIICFALTRKFAKAETSFIMTLIVAAFGLITLMLIPMVEEGSFTFDTVLPYYEDLIESIRTVFVNTSMDMYGEFLAGAGMEVSESDFSAMFDSVLSTMVSYLVIISFIAVGIAMKLFGAVYARLAENKTPIIQWRFMTTNVYAYFYIVLMLLSVFTSTSAGVFGITVANLYNIFLVVYAYVGFNVALANLSQKIKPALTLIIIVVALLLFASFTLQLLAVFGVLFTIRKNRESTSKAE